MPKHQLEDNEFNVNAYKCLMRHTFKCFKKLNHQM